MPPIQNLFNNDQLSLEVVDDLRNKEEAKKQARGKEEVPHNVIMEIKLQNFLKNKESSTSWYGRV
jgi:hypothetical protein